MQSDGTKKVNTLGVGSFVIEVVGIEGAKIVDRVVASVIPLDTTTSFYAPELIWEEKANRWVGVESHVAPGRYAVSVDAEVDGVWLWEPDSTTMEVFPGQNTQVSFRIEDKIRLDQRWFNQERIYLTDPAKGMLTEWEQRNGSSEVVIAMGGRARKSR